MKINNIKKRLAIGLLVFAGIILFLFVVEYAAISLTVKNEVLKKNITEYFKNTFNKAVLFDRVTVSPAGTVTLTDFVMSKEGDFNDSVDFIKSKNLYINLSLINLFRNRVQVTGISLPDAEINIVKNSGVSYDEFIKRLFQPKKNMNVLARHELKNFSAEIRNATVRYREIYALDSADLVLKGMDADLSFDDGSMHIATKGKINKFRNKYDGDGSFIFDGFFRFSDENAESIVSSRILDFRISDFDISYLSPYIRDVLYPDIHFTGTAGAELMITEIDQSGSCSGSIDIDDININKARDNEAKQQMVTDAKLHCDIIAEKTGTSKYSLRKLVVSDGISSVNAEGIVNTGLNNSFEGIVSIKAEELNPFFAKVPVLGQYAVSGMIDVAAHCAIDITNETDDIIDGFIRLNNIRSNVIKKGDIQIEASRNTIASTAAVQWDNSDVAVSVNTDVIRWNDFSSKTKIALSSEKISGSVLGRSFINAIHSLYQDAWDDRKRGYEDIKFLSTTAGHYIAGNDIYLNAKIKTIDMNGALLKNGELAVNLVSGRLSTDVFSLNGYNAAYSFKAEGLFNTDFPMLKIESSVNGFDLSAVKDAKIKGIESGILNAVFNYSMNGNRLSHIVENGTIDASFDIQNAEITRNDLLDRFYGYTGENGLSAKPSHMKIARAGFIYKQIGDNGMIGDFTCSSDVLNFSGYGKYNYNDGLKIALPSVLFFTANPDGSFKNENAPFIIAGRLLEPSVAVDKKNVSGNLILYKIN